MDKTKLLKMDFRLVYPTFTLYDVLVYSFLANEYKNELPEISHIANCLYATERTISKSLSRLEDEELMSFSKEGKVVKFSFLYGKRTYSVPAMIETSLFRLKDKAFLLKLYPFLVFNSGSSIGEFPFSIEKVSDSIGVEIEDFLYYLKCFTIIGFVEKVIRDEEEVYLFDFSKLSKYHALVNFPEKLSVNSWQNLMEEALDGKIEIPHYVFSGDSRELRIFN